MNKREFAERLKVTYRDIFDRAIEYEEISPTEMLVKTDNGRVYLYNTWGDTIRNMPKDSNMDRDNFAVEVGERLRRIMDKKGVTQEILSKKTGITQTMISRYIIGKSIPSLYSADRISRALECDIRDFLYRYWERPCSKNH